MRVREKKQSKGHLVFDSDIPRYHKLTCCIQSTTTPTPLNHSCFYKLPKYNHQQIVLRLAKQITPGQKKAVGIFSFNLISFN